MQEKESSMGVRYGSDKSVPWVTVWHHSASLVMLNSVPWDRFVYSYLTLMIDSYSILQGRSYLYANTQVRVEIFVILTKFQRAPAHLQAGNF